VAAGSLAAQRPCLSSSAAVSAKAKIPDVTITAEFRPDESIGLAPTAAEPNPARRCSARRTPMRPTASSFLSAPQLATPSMRSSTPAAPTWWRVYYDRFGAEDGLIATTF